MGNGGPTFVSTFSSIGGLDLGLERAGFRCVLQAELDEFRRAVLAERFPGVPVYDDVRKVARDEWSSALRPDVLCGGFPCQDLSVAGKRAGLAGERSGLFFEFARIAGTIRPRFILLENVPGLLSSNGGRDFGELLGTLADIGYGVAWRILDSRFFGVPQRRRRVFIVAHHSGGRAGAERAGEVLAVGSGCGGHPAAGGEAGAGPADGAVCGPLGGVRRGVPNAEQAADGQVIVSTLQAHKTGGGRRDSGVAHGSSVRRLTPGECERLQGFPDGWTDIEWKGKPAADSRRYAACGDAVTVNVAEWIGGRLMAEVLNG